VKRTHLAVILIPLLLALPSCGGDDSNESTAPTAGAGTSATAERAPSNSKDGTTGRARAKESAPTGSGGSSSADAERAAGQPGSGKKKSSGSVAPTAPRPEREQAAKPKTPQEHLAALSPDERRRLHKDLYEQGKNFCYAYGPEQLAKEFKLTGSGAQTIAQQYARLYEAATPTLILPFQQGCLAGFRRHARNPPKS
jgi:hypothetical protein